MVQSLNTKVDLTVKATSYLGLANYGAVSYTHLTLPTIA